MKKTLVAIFALSSVAAADVTLYDATFANGGTSTLTNYRSHLTVGDKAITLSSWMIEFQITKQKDVGTFFSTYRKCSYEEDGQITTEERGGLGIRTNSRSGLSITRKADKDFASSKLAVIKFDSNPPTDDAAEVSTSNPITLRFAYDAVNHEAYLYNVGTGEYVSAENLEASDTYSLTTVSSSVTGNGDIDGKTMFWTDGGSANYKLLGVTDMSSLAGKSDFLAHVTAPEPTTATLSLLALMGLAARRRRRAA